MPNTTIELRQSGSTGNTPSLGVLANGELAINRADGILYYKSASNTLGSIRTTQPAGLTTEVQFNDAGSFGTDANFTFNKSTDILTVIGGVIAAGINVAPAISSNAAFSAAAFSHANTRLANTGTSVIANGLSQYTFANSTPSTSTTTGTIVISGGLGVAGNIYANAVYDGGVEILTFTQAAFDKANSVTQQGFVTIAANGINVVADANNDTLTLTAANGVGIFANATTDAITINLTPTGVTSGTYANATHVPVITVDTFGRLTSVSNTIIQSATTSQNGIVRLNDTITSTSTTQAGTANSVTTAYVTATADALAFAVALG